MRSRLLVLATALTLAAPATGQGQEDGPVPADPDAALARIQADIQAGRETQAELDRRAQEAAADLERLRARAMDAAAAIVERQAAVRDLDRQIADLTAREAARLAELEAGRARLSRLLGGLQRLALVPAEALLARPEAPTHTVRSALLLRAAVPSLEAEAAELARTVDHLTALRAETAARRQAADSERATLAADLADLEALVARRQDFLSDTAARRAVVEERLARLAAEAEDLSGLIDRLEAERRARERARASEEAARFAAEEAAREASERAARIRSETTRPMPDVAVVEGVILPTAGDVVLRYGQADGRGEVSRGLRLQADPGAPVVAPLDGTVRFAGPFRGYGLILILEHGDGYHSTIAGLGRIDAQAGQDVLAGEPIAVTPLPQSRAIDSAAAAPGAVAAVAGAAEGNGAVDRAETSDGDAAAAEPRPAGPTRADAEATDGALEEGGARLSGSGAGADRPVLYFEFRRNGQPINPIQGLAEAQRRGRG